MLNKIILAGGSGFLGQVLSAYYRQKAKEIIILSRSDHPSTGPIHYVLWDAKTRGTWEQALEGADLLINLCGKNVNCRYTKKNREEIFRSRLDPTQVLGKSLAELHEPPKNWINLASATIYRHAEDHHQDEASGETGCGFSVEVCKAWEKIFLEAKTPRTKKIILRTSIVLGKKGGLLPILRNLVKWGMGGSQGRGQQYISWLHEQDFARITEWLIENGKDGEIYNATAPEALPNKKLMTILRQQLPCPFGLAMPRWLLETGALLIGTETELVLKSRWVYPKHLLQEGFTFSFPQLREALKDLLQPRS